MVGVLVFAVVLFLGGGAYIVFIMNSEDGLPMEDDATTEHDTIMTKDDSVMEDKGDPMMEDRGDPIMDDTSIQDSFTGALLAGSETPLLDFTKSDYDKALASKKIIVLYFYANWCPICKAEFPKMQSAFNSFSSNEIVGFRVNFNDNETDQYEKDLARQFGVAYQHTKVILKDGERVLKSPESWEESRYISEINMVAKN